MTKQGPADTNVRYEVITQEDHETGDLLLPIPPSLLDALGLKEGDDVEIEVSHDGVIFLKKATK